MFIEKNKSIKILVYALIIAAFIVTTPRVSANSPVPTGKISISFGDEYPEGVAFVDLLIPLSTNSSKYVTYNQEIGEQYAIDSDSQIVNYSEDGFVSYTFHHKEVLPGMEISEPEKYSSSSAEFVDAEYILREDQLEFIKVAFLDDKGNILHVTEKIQVTGMKLHSFTEHIHIDPHTFAVQGDSSRFSVLALIVVIILMSIRVAFSVSLEVFIASLFKLTQLHKIIILNLTTQVLLTIFMLSTSLPYVQAVIIGEIAVYLIEGIALTFMYRDIRNSKLIIFNVVANTVTLVLGLLFNMTGIFKY